MIYLKARSYVEIIIIRLEAAELQNDQFESNSWWVIFACLADSQII